MAESYTCFGPDREDLTTAVLKALREDLPVMRMELGTPVEERRARRIAVTCSQGHQNVFEV